ncbi:TonB-dependent receptor [Lysobacter pythonis]|uniref:TonB-dependent receptor n=1 Tax=Solilutibacter pythonis TaxID=2483112 RepID=A0A3M2I3D5_9GAMM|nr:TonB-dependent receptor [Lysobacter pythonis]RMH94089.1 TonB-dependent receptor [Lysobacter pythonis]
MSPSRHTLCGAIAFALAMPGMALAAEADASPAPQQLDRVVVTAAGFEQKLADAPASISVVAREELEKRPYSNLIDALRDIEGIDVGMETTDKNGMATISMRGMPSDYTLVLIDGRRQSNVGSIYPNNFGGGQFSFLPPLDAIDRIEVVRGPMSTLYGSDAMGGVVNIITRRVGDAWRGSLRQGFTFQQDKHFGNARASDVYLGGPLVKDRLGFAFRGGHYRQDESIPEWPSLTLPDGSEWNRALGFGRGGKQVANTHWNAGVRLDWTPNDAHRFLFDYDVSRQKYDNRQGQTGTLDGIASLWRSGNAVIPNPNGNGTLTRRVVQPRVGYTPEQRYEREQASLTHIGEWSFGRSETSLMRIGSRNLGRSLPLTIAERAELQTLWNEVCTRRGQAAYCNNGSLAASRLTADERARLGAFLPRPLRTLELRGWVLDSKLEVNAEDHRLTVGGQLNDTDMEDGVFGMGRAEYRNGVTQKHRQWALFAEDNWRFAPGLTATLGLRYDRHNLFGSHFSPRGYLVWEATDAWTIKGGISTGYKTPRPDQLFPGITGFGGQGVLPLVGTPGLKPETSRNYELAAYYEGERYGLNATAFLNRFKDKIARGGIYPNCEVTKPGSGYCVDIGQGWAALGYSSFAQTVNIDSADTRGVELAGHVKLAEDWNLRGNYTWTRSRQTSGAKRGSPIAGNPAKHMLNASLNWQVTPTFGLNLGGEGRFNRYYGMDAAGKDIYYKNHVLLHLGGSWQATGWLTINARVNNLLDRNFISQSCTLAAGADSFDCRDDYAVKEQRRSFWLSFNARF